MEKYITRKRYKKKCISGEVNFPYNTEFICTDDGLLIYDKKPICYITSQDGCDYFSYNDDGKGIERGRLIEEILELMETKDSVKKEKILSLLWNDSYIRDNFKNKDHDITWLWNINFYKAKIKDLEMILQKIKNV